MYMDIKSKRKKGKIFRSNHLFQVKRLSSDMIEQIVWIKNKNYVIIKSQFKTFDNPSNITCGGYYILPSGEFLQA